MCLLLKYTVPKYLLNLRWSRNCLPFDSTWAHPRFSLVLHTRSLVLCVCFVGRCSSFCTFCFLFFFNVWKLITPLVSSSSATLMDIDYPVGYLAPRCLIYFAFHSFGYELTRRWLFQKRIAACHNFDICVALLLRTRISFI